MTPTLRWLPPKPTSSHLLLDSNLLLLLTVGSYNQHLISTFKRTGNYTADDYQILRHFASDFRHLVTTPHILTEVSNLANSLPYYVKEEWFVHFSGRISDLDEHDIPARDLARTPEFGLFGLADAALSLLAKSTLVATADDRLCDYLHRRNLHAISFNEIRAAHLSGL